MKETPVRGEELAKAVKQFTAATLASRKTMQGQAQDLAATGSLPATSLLGPLFGSCQARHPCRPAARGPPVPHRGEPHTLRSAPQRRPPAPRHLPANNRRPSHPQI